MAGGHLHSQSFLLSPGRNVTHVRQVTHGCVRTTELVLEKNEQKKKLGKLLTLEGTERELSDTAGQCPPP